MCKWKSVETEKKIYEMMKTLQIVHIDLKKNRCPTKWNINTNKLWVNDATRLVKLNKLQFSRYFKGKEYEKWECLNKERQ